MWFAWAVPANASPEPAPVRAVDSYARRVGDDVQVVIVLEDDLRDRVGQALTNRRVWLRLGRQVGEERVRFRVPAEVTAGERPRVTATVPLAEATPGTWNLALRVGQDGPVVPLEARLLTTDPAVQPIALLAGPRPATKMEEPAPR